MPAADIRAWLPLLAPADILDRVKDVKPLSQTERYNAVPGTLDRQDGIDCPLCLNRGTVATEDETGCLLVRECSCMAKRRSVRLLRASGLQDMVSRCRFSTYETPDEWTRTAKAAAIAYLRSEPGTWLFLSGSPGTGKTHLATAVCRRLIDAGQSTKYMLWREDAPRLKALVNDPTYKEELGRYLEPSVLYIDDFLKASGAPSPGDLNLAFAIINARYNQRRKRTVLSTELSLRVLRQLDPAIAGRIRERAAGYILEAPAGAVNWRER